MAPFALLAAYATGIAMVCCIAPWSITGYCIAIGFLLLLWASLYRSKWTWLPFLGFLLLAGFMHASQQLAPPFPANHIGRFADQSPLTLEGTILMIESSVTGASRLTVEMRSVIDKQSMAKVSGELLLSIKEGELVGKPGQVIRWRSRIRRPISFGNPGEFDYPLYLAARGIYATAFIARAEDLVILVNHPETQSKVLDNLRHTLATHIAQIVPEETTGLVQSLLLGMRGGVSDTQRRVLSESGIAHLFAISGLHFGLLALLLYQASKWLYTRSQRLTLFCPPQRILPLLLIFPLAAYLLLTGNAWGSRRAFLIMALVTLLLSRDRRTSPLALLATVALAILLFTPLALFQPGFQLSFAGVLGILVWLPCWQRPLTNASRAIRWPVTMILTTAAATIATAPATLWHFHQFAPAGLLTNLIAIPLVAWGAVPVGLVSIAAMPFYSLIADLGLLLCAKLVTMAITVSSTISQWPVLSAIPVYLTTSGLILCIGAITFLLPFGKQSRSWLIRLGVLLATFAIAWLVRPQVADFQITAVSVGQGDATLVSLAGGVHYLIDGGGLPGSSIDPGERLIAPTLGRMGIERLQGIVLTHNHPDHSSGLTYILHRFQVENFYFAEELANLAPELQDVLKQSKATLHQVNEGWTHIQSNSDQEFSLFTPLQSARDMNERSIAVFVGQQNYGVLLPADLGKKGLQQLFTQGLPGHVSLLKLPHHGSRNSQPKWYLQQIQPSTAFVSAGHNNLYGFPHLQTIAACTEQKIPLFRTDQEGMLTFRLHEGCWEVDRGRPL